MESLQFAIIFEYFKIQLSGLKNLVTYNENYLLSKLLLEFQNQINIEYLFCYYYCFEGEIIDVLLTLKCLIQLLTIILSYKKKIEDVIFFQFQPNSNN